ncbi:MAG: 50S ribosomal protein L32 [Myxococcales bacterium]|nr:50S ribosomal protein L32 [Myxococcales bacterium]
MAVPKRKTTRAKRDQRRANHDRVTAPNTIPCPNCGDMMLPHRVCPNCGHYKGREIIAKPEPAPVPEAEAGEGDAS